ncbi:reverse transcriptase domain-containing protein [Tanacetum coccineum]
MPLRKAPRTRTTPATAITTTTTTTTPMTDEQLKTLIAQGIVDVLAEHDATRSRNGEDNHDSGMGVRRQTPLARECTYPNFMKCKPLYFKGTEGVIELTQWFKIMKIVFRISNCAVENRIMFATCTLLESALTWWKSHVRTVGHDVAYAITWTNLKKMMTDKYCPRGEIKKLEVEMWNLKVKEMQDAIEFATKLMDKKISTLAERQAENKRKLDNINMLNYKLFPRKQGGGDSLYRRVSKREGESVLITDQRNLTCYEYGNQGHYKSDFPELKNRNHENQAESTEACGMELLPLKKRGRDRSSSSTSALPQAFEIGESSCKTSLERHEEKIEEILNHLDELSLDRIEHIEDKIEGLGKGRDITIVTIMPPKRTSTSEAPAMTQAVIRKLVADSVFSNSLEANSSEGAVGLIRWFKRTESVFSRSNYTKDCNVKFATEEAYKITWVEFKMLLIKKYCPRTEVQKMEDEFYHLTVKGNDLKAYVRRFQELETLCPTMVPYSKKMMEVFIGGLPRSIKGNVTAFKPQTLEEAINIA